ncbi:MAG: protein-methionine-sulfoxide reductase heme-binding subunit MsrQ [Micropepsaceae bacterium]
MAATASPTALQRIHGALRRLPTWSVYLLCMAPAIVYAALAFSDRLGADPARALEHGLGLWGLRLLLVGLAVTPLRQITGLNLVGFRRVIGLAAFTTVALHLLSWAWLDVSFDPAAMWKDITRRPYITIGMAAFVLLIPLAVTSTNAMIRRLGPKAWGRLHKAVYLIAILGGLHFLLLKKTIQPEPLIYLGLAVVLVGWRLIPKRRPRAPAGA